MQIKPVHISFVALLLAPAMLQHESASREHPPQTIKDPYLASPTDPDYSNQRASLSSINLESAWDITQGSSQVIVALIDDAIDVNHPDLKANMLSGWDFVDGDADPSPDPQASCTRAESHGTAMAGIIGAVGQNNIGIAGVNWNVKILPIRVGCFYDSQREYQAIKYAVQNGAHIINASYGGPLTTSYRDEIAGLLASNDVLFVTAAGNFHGNNDYAPMYPGNLDTPYVLTVAASNASRELTPWSQYGTNSADVAAPGVNIQTTRYLATSADRISGDYESVDGTSASTAIASGVAALVKAKDYQDGVSDYSALDLKAALLGSVTPLSGTSGKLATDGVINARTALDMLDALPPVITIKQTRWDDETLGNANGVIDPQESGSVVLTLENSGPEALTSMIALRVTEGGLIPGTTSAQLYNLKQGQSQDVTFSVTAPMFEGHRKFILDLDISASGAVNASNTTRRAILEAGYLTPGVLLTQSLQQNAYDDYKYYHLNVPASALSVVLEVFYNTSAERDIGLAVSPSARPRIYFGDYTNTLYDVPNAVVRDDQNGVERYALPISAGGAPKTYHALVFNTPDLARPNLPSSASTFEIRGCYQTGTEVNQLPLVNAGGTLTVQPNSMVELSGTVSDPDGTIQRFWWTADTSNAPELNRADTLTPSLVAPSTGTYRYRLNASDNSCGYQSSIVSILVQDESDIDLGMRVVPSNYSVPVGGYVSSNIEAFIGGQRIANLSMVRHPSGVEYDAQNNFLTWNNASPAGRHQIVFSARDPLTAERIYGELIVNVGGETSSRGSAVGCSTRNRTGFDPLFPGLLLFSVFYWARTRPNRSIE